MIAYSKWDEILVQLKIVWEAFGNILVLFVEGIVDFVGVAGSLV